MVIFLKKTFLPAVLLYAIFFAGCNIDFFGAFASTDLDERLEDKNNLKFILNNNWEKIDELPNEYSFVVTNDLHIEDGNAFSFNKLPDAVTAYNADAELPIKFVVVSGDITQYGAEKDIKKFIETAENMGVPCYPVIGNHDIYFGNWSVWRRLIGSTRYRIDSGNTSLFVLDSANSYFGKQQLDWLQSELLSANENVFVFTHSPLFVEGPVGMQQITDARERARIISILKDKCNMMFMGHSHKRVINKTGNVEYISIEDFKSFKTYCIVTVRNSGISYEFKNL